jgi:hypothetical protein
MSYAYPFNINGLLNNVYLVSLALSALFTCYTWPLLIPCTIPGPSWFHALYLAPLDSMHYTWPLLIPCTMHYALLLLPSDSMHYPCFPLILCTTPASLRVHELSQVASALPVLYIQMYTHTHACKHQIYMHIHTHIYMYAKGRHLGSHILFKILKINIVILFTSIYLTWKWTSTNED